MVNTKGFSLDWCGCKSLFVQSANTTHMFESDTNLAAVSTSILGSLVHEVKWSLFGSSFDVLDSGLSSEMNASSQRTRVGRAVTNSQVPKKCNGPWLDGGEIGPVVAEEAPYHQFRKLYIILI